jgi:deoxyribose-phosphate aldolase
VLAGCDVKVCVPVGLPFGTCSTQVKLLEAKTAIGAGANEIDVVLNMGALKSREYLTVSRDLEEIVRVTKFAGMTENGEDVLVHVVLETAHLTKEELESACRIALASGAEFVKTGSGLFPCRPGPVEVRLLRQRLGKETGIKVAGDIETAEEVLRLINTGATRVGTVHACRIVESLPSEPEEA